MNKSTGVGEWWSRIGGTQKWLMLRRMRATIHHRMVYNLYAEQVRTSTRWQEHKESTISSRTIPLKLNGEFSQTNEVDRAEVYSRCATLNLVRLTQIISYTRRLGPRDPRLNYKIRNYEYLKYGIQPSGILVQRYFFSLSFISVIVASPQLAQIIPTF